MSKHTPGPWHVGSGSAARIVYAANGWAIADAKVYHGGHKSGQDFENARLMAAAPTMYAYIESSASNGCAEALAIVESINAGR